MGVVSDKAASVRFVSVDVASVHWAWLELNGCGCR